MISIRRCVNFDISDAKMKELDFGLKCQAIDSDNIGRSANIEEGGAEAFL